MLRYLEQQKKEFKAEEKVVEEDDHSHHHHDHGHEHAADHQHQHEEHGHDQAHAHPCSGKKKKVTKEEYDRLKDLLKVKYPQFEMELKKIEREMRENRKQEEEAIMRNEMTFFEPAPERSARTRDKDDVDLVVNRGPDDCRHKDLTLLRQ